ncbi:MAG TPA: hypothetical protein VFK04_08845 [Gemmatimonadaceae bacterium]|nr:hypothetical protein [Gemmatimonadaceae bacterium]
MRPAHVVLVVLALSACSRDALLSRFTPADADARARGYLDLFTRGNVDSAVARLAPTLRSATARSELEKVATLLSAEPVDSMKIVGANTMTWPGRRRVNLTYELYLQPSGWLLANVATLDSAGTWVVEGVSARPLSRPIEESARFSLSHKPLVDYLWLVIAGLCAVLSVGAAVFIATRRQMPNHWWWALASLVGVGGYSLNWATGQTGMSLFKVQLFSAAALQMGPFAPWIVTFSFPLGAVVALSKYRDWRNRTAEGDASSVSRGPTPEAAV